MTDDLEIPTFLRRGHPDCTVIDRPDELSKDNHPAAKAELPFSRPKLTAAYKGRIAMDLIGAIKAGSDTFGKIRTALPRYNDKELRAGLRYGKKWLPMLERRGSINKPHMHKYHARIEQKGRRYDIATY